LLKKIHNFTINAPISNKPNISVNNIKVGNTIFAFKVTAKNLNENSLSKGNTKKH